MINNKLKENNEEEPIEFLSVPRWSFQILTHLNHSFVIYETANVAEIHKNL